jgi:hypothetical protein
MEIKRASASPSPAEADHADRGGRGGGHGYVNIGLAGPAARALAVVPKSLQIGAAFGTKKVGKGVDSFG